MTATASATAATTSPAATTRTGAFPIAFRRGWSDWQKDVDQVAAFARAQRFAGIDVGAIPRAEIDRIAATGLRIGTIDLPGPWSDLASSDAGKRAAASDRILAYAATVVDRCRIFFTVVIPEDQARRRAENFAFAVDGHQRLCAGLAKLGATLAIEGWPGGDPHLASLACTPADYRAFLKELPRESAGINFDPSHLVRMGIDPVRFVGEFAPQIRHVHAKDTEISPEDLYEHGWSQPATFAKGHGFGGHYWRYTIPGHGQVRWTRCFEVLAQAGYKGMVSIELEDERFNVSADGERDGLNAGRDFLVSA